MTRLRHTKTDAVRADDELTNRMLGSEPVRTETGGAATVAVATKGRESSKTCQAQLLRSHHSGALELTRADG